MLLMLLPGTVSVALHVYVACFTGFLCKCAQLFLTGTTFFAVHEKKTLMIYNPVFCCTDGGRDEDADRDENDEYFIQPACCAAAE